MGTWGIGDGSPVTWDGGSSCDLASPDNHGSGIEPERRMPLSPVTKPANARSKTTPTKSAMPAQEMVAFLLVFARDRCGVRLSLSLSVVRPTVASTSTRVIVGPRACQP